jgi:hypothetical protein
MFEFLKNWYKNHRIKNALCNSNDAYTLIKYENGAIIDKNDKYTLDRLARVGLVHLGTHEEVNVQDDKIEVVPTAGLTALGRKMI